MKFILTALFAASVSSAFAADCDCPNKADKVKKGTIVAADGDCKKGDCKKKEEGTLAECEKCKKGDKKEEGTIA